jgi:hypothetical protein
MSAYGLFTCVPCGDEPSDSCADECIEEWPDELPSFSLDVAGVAAWDEQVAGKLCCTPAEVEELVLEPLSDLLLKECDAPSPEHDYWPACRCCGRPAQLVTPLAPVRF